jgi:hypothetical protein
MMEDTAMTIIHAQLFDEGAVLPRDEFERLVELARKSEEVEVHLQEDDAPTQSIMRLAEQGGAFDFWRDEGEDIYSAEDGEPL